MTKQLFTKNLELKAQKEKLIVDGEKVAIIAVGKMVQHAMIARKEQKDLENQGKIEEYNKEM